MAEGELKGWADPAELPTAGRWPLSRQTCPKCTSRKIRTVGSTEEGDVVRACEACGFLGASS